MSHARRRFALRRLPRDLGRALIWLYRHTLSPLVGYNCRHLPTCSVYGDEAIARFGLWAGGWMTLARLLRCHPFGTSGIDNVPSEAPRGRALVSALALRALARGQCAIRRMIRKSVKRFSEKIMRKSSQALLRRFQEKAALLPFGNRQFPLRIVLLSLLGEETMRWKISPHGHDARQIDLLAVVALLIVIVSALLYFDRSPQPTDTAASSCRARACAGKQRSGLPPEPEEAVPRLRLGLLRTRLRRRRHRLG